MKPASKLLIWIFLLLLVGFTVLLQNNVSKSSKSGSAWLALSRRPLQPDVRLFPLSAEPYIRVPVAFLRRGNSSEEATLSQTAIDVTEETSKLPLGNDPKRIGTVILVKVIPVSRTYDRRTTVEGADFDVTVFDAVDNAIIWEQYIRAVFPESIECPQSGNCSHFPIFPSDDLVKQLASWPRIAYDQAGPATGLPERATKPSVTVKETT